MPPLARVSGGCRGNVPSPLSLGVYLHGAVTPKLSLPMFVCPPCHPTSPHMRPRAEALSGFLCTPPPRGRSLSTQRAFQGRAESPGAAVHGDPAMRTPFKGDGVHVWGGRVMRGGVPEWRSLCPSLTAHFPKGSQKSGGGKRWLAGGCGAAGVVCAPHSIMAIDYCTGPL